MRSKFHWNDEKYDGELYFFYGLGKAISKNFRGLPTIPRDSYLCGRWDVFCGFAFYHAVPIAVTAALVRLGLERLLN